MSVLTQLADLLRRVDNRAAAIRGLTEASFQADDLDGTIIRIRVGEDTWYLELRPLRSVPVADISFEGVFIQPAVVFWASWLIYDSGAELLMVVKVELPVAH